MKGLDAALLAQLDDSIGDVSTASTLPPELYTSAEVLEFEGEALFAHEWLCVGRADRIPEAGGWFTVDYVGEPIVVVRDKTGAVNAMSAVCQHRAMQVCEGAGTSTTFKCPYHHWNYALDGRLLGAPAMERTAGFVKSEFGLPRLRVEEWQGFVFVNMDPAATPLGPTLARYEPFLEHYDLADTVCPGTFTLTDLPWNWKVMFENFNDGYHANRLHQFVQDFCPSGMTGFPTPWSADSNVIFRTAGYTHLDGGFNATHRAIMPVFPRLTDEERMRSTFALVPPTLCFGTAPDQCFFFLVRPTGPETIDVEIGYLFHPSALDDPLSSTSSNSPMSACRCSSARTKTPPPRSNGGCDPASHREVATPGRRRATSSSTAGSSTATAATRDKPAVGTHLPLSFPGRYLYNFSHDHPRG